MPSQPVTFLVSLHDAEGRLDEFMGVLQPVLDAMRHEPTFINAVLHRSPEDPHRLMLYETWADLDDVRDVQLNRDYREDYHSRLEELLRAPREISVWTPVRSDLAMFAGRSPVCAA